MLGFRVEGGSGFRGLLVFRTECLGFGAGSKPSPGALEPSF